MNINDATITSKAFTTIDLHGKITVNSGKISNIGMYGDVPNRCVSDIDALKKVKLIQK